MFTLTTPVSGACLPWVLGMLVIGPQSSMNGSVSMIMGTHSILRAVEMLAGKSTVYFVRIWNHRFFFFRSSFLCWFFPPYFFFPLTYGLFYKSILKFVSSCLIQKESRECIHSFTHSANIFWAPLCVTDPALGTEIQQETNKNPCLHWAKCYGGEVKETTKSNKFYAWWW